MGDSIDEELVSIRARTIYARMSKGHSAFNFHGASIKVSPDVLLSLTDEGMQRLSYSLARKSERFKDNEVSE